MIRRESSSSFLGVYALSPTRPTSTPWKGKQKEIPLPSPPAPTSNPSLSNSIAGSTRKRLKLTLREPEGTVEGGREVGRSSSCHQCRNVKNRVGSIMHFTISCEGCGVSWHADCIIKRYDYSTIPSPISTTLSTCPACLKICPCQRCVNPHVRPPPKPAPNAPRQSMKNRKRAIKRRKAGQFAARGSAKEPVRIGEVREVERRVFESAGVLEMRIRDERKKGRQEHWERFLTSSNTRSGEEDDYPPTKKKEDAYSSVDESEDSESEYEEKGYWLSSTESVESCATSLSGVTWSGGKGREGGKFLNRSKGVSPSSTRESSLETIPPSDEIVLPIPAPDSPTPTFSIPSLEFLSSPTKNSDMVLLDSFSDEQLGSAIRTLLLAGPSSFGLSLFCTTRTDVDPFCTARDEARTTLGMKRRREGESGTTLAPALRSIEPVDGEMEIVTEGHEELERDEEGGFVGTELEDRHLTPTFGGTTQNEAERLEGVQYGLSDWTEDWLVD